MNSRTGQSPIVAGSNAVADEALIAAVNGHCSDLPLAKGVGAEVYFKTIRTEDGRSIGAGALGQAHKFAIVQGEAVDFPVAGTGARGEDKAVSGRM